MSEFKITLARIEAVEESEQDRPIRAVFLVEHGPVGFQVPICLRARDFDDTEMVQATRNSLHQMFVDMARQRSVWELSAAELDRLSKMNPRPGEQAGGNCS